MILKAAVYKGQASRARYIVTLFKNDMVPMMIFSYLWTDKQAQKKVRELNSKANDIAREGSIMESFPGLFIDLESSRPEPNQDFFFDDFVDLNFAEYKDVHINALSLYDNGEYLNGLELSYLVDGD